MQIDKEPIWMTKANQVLKIAAVAGGIAIGLHLLMGRPAKAIEPRLTVQSSQCKVVGGQLSCY